MDYLAEGRRLPREGVLLPLFVLFLLGQSHVKGQPPLRHMARFQGSGSRLLFLHMVKTSTGWGWGGAALVWRLRLDSRGGENTTCKLTRSHSRALPSLVPLCTETLKARRAHGSGNCEKHIRGSCPAPCVTASPACIPPSGVARPSAHFVMDH